MTNKWTRRSLITALGAAALVPWIPRAARAELLELAGPTMGTRYRVRLRDVPEGLYLPRLKRSIERELEATEALMSTYRRDSELARFNASTLRSWQPISATTARVLATAEQVRDESSGAFDPAAAPLIQLWGFGAAAGNPRVSAPVPAGLLSRVVHAGIELEADRVRKHHPHAALDLNGVAKGEALDRVASMLEAAGLADYLVEIGGEVRARGPGPGGSGWRIGIEHPGGGIGWMVALERQALATSGDYVDFFVEGGRRYCHILDPRTGRPVEHGLSLVSVVAPSAMEADAWATALMVMGPEEGWRHAVGHSLRALFVVREGEGYREIMTPAFDQLRGRIS